jgi:predicted GTPase
VAPIGHFRPRTADVKTYTGRFNGVRISVVDTPGLCDALEEKGNDQEYIKKMRAQIQSVDCVLFTTQLDDARVTADESRAIRIISKEFKEDFWQHSLIIFTRAGNIPIDRYERTLKERARLIRAEIAQYAGANVSRLIPAVAVDNQHETTPDGRKWLGELFTKVVVRISKKGTLPFILAMKDSILPDAKSNKKTDVAPISHKSGAVYQSTARIELDESQKEQVSKKIDGSIIAGATLAGTALGSIFGPAGAVVGGAIGALVGIVTWFRRK